MNEDRAQAQAIARSAAIIAVGYLYKVNQFVAGTWQRGEPKLIDDNQGVLNYTVQFQINHDYELLVTTTIFNMYSPQVLIVNDSGKRIFSARIYLNGGVEPASLYLDRSTLKMTS